MCVSRSLRKAPKELADRAPKGNEFHNLEPATEKQQSKCFLDFNKSKKIKYIVDFYTFCRFPFHISIFNLTENNKFLAYLKPIFLSYFLFFQESIKMREKKEQIKPMHCVCC